MNNQYLLFKVFYENQYLSAGKDNSTSQVESIEANIYTDTLSLPLNTQKSYPVMHFPMTLHDDDVFALDINFLRFVGYLQPWDKPSNDIFSEKKQKKNEYGAFRRYFFS